MTPAAASKEMGEKDVAAILDTVSREVPGWTPFDQLLTLFTLAMGSAGRGGALLELGSWCGRSAVALGLAAQRSQTQLHCIDLFPAKDDWQRNPDGSWSMRVRLGSSMVAAYTGQTVWAEPFARDIAPLYEKWSSTLDAFQHTITRFGLGDSVRWYRGTSELLESTPLSDVVVRMAFIDGDHGYAEVRRDVERIVPRLVRGGWLCFDDAFTSYDGVDAAIRDGVLADPHFSNGVQITRKMFAVQRND